MRLIPIDRQWLTEQYITNKRSTIYIANEINVSSTCITRRLKRYGIPVRTISEARIGAIPWNKGKTGIYTNETLQQMSVSAMNLPKFADSISKKELEQLYLDERKSAGMIAKELGTSRNTVLNCLKMYEIPKRDRETSVIESIGIGNGKGSYFMKKDNTTTWLRSTYETRIATLLEASNIKWNYESKSFHLQKLNSIYHPDFYLIDYDLWWEVKGWMRPEAKNKLTTFFEQYPNIKLKILYENDIKKMEKIGIITKYNIHSFGCSNM